MDREEPLFLPDPVVSRQELWIRAVCGAIFGIFAGLYVANRLYPIDAGWCIAILLGSVVGCACGAVWYGDRFWNALRPSSRRIW